MSGQPLVLGLVPLLLNNQHPQEPRRVGALELLGAA